MQKFDIEIPTELITAGDNEIKFEFLKGKTVSGMLGFSKSGKDSIGKILVSNLGFKRISFGDALKSNLDNHMKIQVFEDLKSKNIEIEFEDVDFLHPKNPDIKELLRPYMIWFGEEMRRRNGQYHWINKALSEIEENDRKIVITDVRRLSELELFMFNKEQHKRKIKHMEMAGMSVDFIEENNSNEEFESLLIHVNQFKLEDGDKLTQETIMTAHRNWLIDDTVFIDSRIPEKNREKYIYKQVLELVKKFPEYFI